MREAEENIQKEIERGKIPVIPDDEAYRLVFDVLGKEPRFKLSADFASKVALAASSKKSFNWDQFFLISGCFGFIAALIYAFLSVKPSFTTGVFQFVSGYPGLFIFGVLFILALNWVDKKFIRHHS